MTGTSLSLYRMLIENAFPNGWPGWQYLHFLLVFQPSLPSLSKCSGGEQNTLSTVDNIQPYADQLCHIAVVLDLEVSAPPDIVTDSIFHYKTQPLVAILVLPSLLYSAHHKVYSFGAFSLRLLTIRFAWGTINSSSESRSPLSLTSWVMSFWLLFFTLVLIALLPSKLPLPVTWLTARPRCWQQQSPYATMPGSFLLACTSMRQDYCTRTQLNHSQKMRTHQEKWLLLCLLTVSQTSFIQSLLG